MKNSNTKLKLNTISSIVLQIVTIICGFILPRLILGQYGSSVNGLVSSITQFLSLITFLELGVGAVIQSALYKPLADKDNVKISEIVSSGGKFFKTIAKILFIYVISLIIVYPFIVRSEFGWLYTTILIVAISISSFAQYYFGLIDQLLLTADQRGYIQYSLQIFTLIANTIVCAILIKCGCSIQIVKLVSSTVFLIRPLIQRKYIIKHYSIDRNIYYEKEPIDQKWNGIAQHIAAIILKDADTIILTLFSTLSNVSIYAVYNLVIIGLKNLFLSATNGIQSLIGELWAKQELEKLNKIFRLFEWALHSAVVFMFTCAGILIVPFISVYTKGISDANYIQYPFAILLTIAHSGHCLRLPYNITILAAGHYKQTQSNYIIAAVLNVVISVAAVWKYGLVGVAIGTMVAMIYQTIWMAIYDSKNIIKWPIKNFIKQCIFDVIASGLIVISTLWIKLGELTYMSWIIMAFKVAVIAIIIIIISSSVSYRDNVKQVLYLVVRKNAKQSN